MNLLRRIFNVIMLLSMFTSSQTLLHGAEAALFEEPFTDFKGRGFFVPLCYLDEHKAKSTTLKLTLNKKIDANHSIQHSSFKLFDKKLNDYLA